MMDQATLRGMVILVADDDPVLAQTLQMLFTAAGAKEVLHAADGLLAQAVLAANMDRIDAVVLDLRMPNGDGVGFLRDARKLGYRGKLIINSGESIDVVRCAEKLAHLFGLHCVGALHKPINPVALITLLSQESDHVAKIDDMAGQHRDIRLEKVLYQPRVNIRTGEYVGAEALSRFTDENGQPVNPEAAITAAEHDGTIDTLTWQITDIVLRDAKRFRDETRMVRPVSINISADSLSKEGFADELARRVTDAGLETHDFIVEMTETRLVSDAIAALENLTRLRIRDFGVALDDFGTGHSNAEQLGTYPFTELKIDKQFAMRAETDRFASCFLETVAVLGRSIGVGILVEGVETQWAVDYLLKLGIDEVQGFHYSKPIPLPELIAYANSHR